MGKKPDISTSVFSVDTGRITELATIPASVIIYAPAHTNTTLTVNDSASADFDYYITMRSNKTGANGEHLWGEPQLIKPSGFVLSQFLLENPMFATFNFDNIKIEKVAKATGCTSDPIEVGLSIFNTSINGNFIEKADGNSAAKDMYVCRNARNKTVKGYPATGGIRISYQWQYQADGTDEWLPMKDNTGNTISTQHLAEGAWAMAIDGTYAIRRLAFATVVSANKTDTISSASAPIFIRNYSKPIFTLSVDGSRFSNQEVCFGKEITLASTVSNTGTMAEQRYDFNSNLRFAYDNGDGKKKLFPNTKIPVTETRTYYAALLFCSDTLYSTNSTLVETEDMTKGWYANEQSCAIMGQKVEVVITPKTGYSYAFVLGNDTIPGLKATIQTPEVVTDDIKYHIIVKNSTCEYTKEQYLYKSDLIKPLPQSHLVLESAGYSESGNTYTVCAGNPVKRTGSNDVYNRNANYEWYKNSKRLDPRKYSTPSFATNLSFADGPCTITRIVRTTDWGSKTCQSITDSVKLKVHNAIGKVMVNHEASFCEARNHSLWVDTKQLEGGSGNYSYEWHKVTANTNVVLNAGSKSTISTPVSETADYYVVVKDNLCTSGAYEATSAKEHIPFWHNSAFSVEATPAQLTSKQLANGEVQVKITSAGLSAGDTVKAFTGDVALTAS